MHEQWGERGGETIWNNATMKPATGVIGAVDGDPVDPDQGAVQDQVGLAAGDAHCGGQVGAERGEQVDGLADVP
jgi:hypothetical protein